MFVDAIERASRFTRPIHTISRWYGSTDIYPSAATLFFVNRDGWALTCRHVVEQLLAGDDIGKRRTDYEGELAAFSDSKVKSFLFWRTKTAWRPRALSSPLSTYFG